MTTASLPAEPPVSGAFALARTLIAQERYQEADAVLRGVRPPADDPAMLAEACRLAARICAHRGEARRARMLADCAHTLLLIGDPAT